MDERLGALGPPQVSMSRWRMRASGAAIPDAPLKQPPSHGCVLLQQDRHSGHSGPDMLSDDGVAYATTLLVRSASAISV